VTVLVSLRAELRYHRRGRQPADGCRGVTGATQRRTHRRRKRTAMSSTLPSYPEPSSLGGFRLSRDLKTQLEQRVRVIARLHGKPDAAPAEAERSRRHTSTRRPRRPSTSDGYARMLVATRSVTTTHKGEPVQITAGRDHAIARSPRSSAPTPTRSRPDRGRGVDSLVSKPRHCALADFSPRHDKSGSCGFCEAEGGGARAASRTLAALRNATGSRVRDGER